MACGSEANKDKIVDMIELKKYSEHDVDTDPMVFLSCGHFFAISTLDGHFGADAASEKSKDCPECPVTNKGVFLAYLGTRSMLPGVLP